MLVSATSVFAAPPWFVRTWQSDEGLPDNTVVGIDQDPNGFLWIATQTGVVRFDGVQFQQVPVKAPGLDDKMIQALFVDRLGRVWVARAGGALVCLEQGRVTVMRQPDKDALGLRSRALAEDGQGAIWVSLIDGKLLRLKDGLFRTYPKLEGLPDGFPELTVDKGGQLWFLTGNRLGVLKEEKVHILQSMDFQRLCKAQVEGVRLCSDKFLAWFTEAEGLKEKVALPAGLSNVGINALLEDRAGRVWIGTRLAGLYYYDGKEFVKVETLHQTILCLKEDREGNIWAGTRGGGLKLVKPRIVELQTIGADVPLRGVQSICQDTAGVIWAVSWHRGTIYRFSQNEWLPLSSLNGWSGTYAKSVSPDPGGGIWIGTTFNGVYAWRDGAIRHQFSQAKGLVGAWVMALKAVGEETVWIGGEKRNSEEPFLQYWKDGMFQTFKLSADSGAVSAIELDTAGDYWFGTMRGALMKIKKGSSSAESQVLLPTPFPIRALLARPDGSLWIGFGGGGLGCLKEGRFKHFQMEQGISDDYISHILADGRGRFWLAGNRGIFSLRERDLNDLNAGRIERVQSVVYKQKDGLPGLQASYDAFPSAFRDKEGRLFFAMQSGVAIVYPEAYQEDRVAPKVIVDRVLANGNPVVRDGLVIEGLVPRGQSGQAGRPGRVSLSPRERQVEFVYTAPCFAMPESIRFRYRLQGLEREWVEAGTRRSVLYSQLAPGEYQLEVMACNKDGVWSEPVVAPVVTILPFWWETTLFHVGAPLLGFALLGGAVLLWFRRHYQFQIEKFELQRAMERERDRIAADLHDEIGANLTHISILSTLAAKPETELNTSRQHNAEVTSVARQTILAFDEILWSVNPKNDTLKSLSHFICRRTEEILAPAKILYHFSLDEALPDTPMSPQRRHGLLLAVKEALHNILKHAGATRVEVTCTVERGQFVVSISDNGCGFDPSVIPVNVKGRRGQGLENMSRRLKELCGECFIERQPEGGIRITFRLPMD